MKKILFAIFLITSISSFAQSKREKQYIQTTDKMYEGKTVFTDDKGSYIWKESTVTKPTETVKDLKIKQPKNKALMAAGGFMIIGSVIQFYSLSLDPPSTGSGASYYSQLTDYYDMQRNLSYATVGSYLVSGAFMMVAGNNIYKSNNEKVAINTAPNGLQFTYSFK